MLCFPRHAGTSFTVGNAIVTITSIGTSKVRIAVQAPPDVIVMREELFTEEEWEAFKAAANAKQTDTTKEAGR
jgi:carbon storage regulator CsrA